MGSLRLLFDSHAPGAWNMAVDEALLQQAGEQATLRFYTWQEPTLSLGYFQAAADRAGHAPSRDCLLVRRSTGGGAILHDRELTYSLVVPQCGGTAAATRIYEAVHGALIHVLARAGIESRLHRDAAACDSKQGEEPFLCFQRRSCFDVVIGASKIAGSAQRRKGKDVLQHGSILLAASACAPELKGIRELTGIALEAGALAEALANALARVLELDARPGRLSDVERAAAEGFERTRFGAREFTEKR